MNKFERVLSDAELISATFKTEVEGTMGELRAVEQAVLAKLAGQEPVAYAAFAGNGSIRIWTVSKTEAGDISEQIGVKVQPLYAHPIPSASPASDKEGCVSESRESDTQRYLEYIKHYQKWRRGEDKTMSEMGLTPKQIGEALDWLIGVAENHIADKRKKVGSNHFPNAGKMVDLDHIPDTGQMIPDGWQLTPTQATGDMYMGFCHVRNDIEPDEFREAYRAMLEAAPKCAGDSNE